MTDVRTTREKTRKSCDFERMLSRVVPVLSRAARSRVAVAVPKRAMSNFHPIGTVRDVFSLVAWPFLLHVLAFEMLHGLILQEDFSLFMLL